MEHLSYSIFQNTSGLGLKKIECLFGPAEIMTDMRLKEDGWKSWKGSEQQGDPVRRMEFMVDASAELFHSGSTILGGFADPTLLHELTRKATGMEKRISLGGEKSAVVVCILYIHVEATLK